MRHFLSILILFIVLTGTTFSQSKDSLVKDIRGKYNRIRENIKRYDTTFTEFHGESTEGGQGTAYYDGKELKLIEGVWLGEMGKIITEYYFDKGKLIFAFDQHFKYNRPIYWDKERAKENGDNESFNPEKTTIKEDRYYYQNEQLFLWLDNEKKEVDLKDVKNSSVGLMKFVHALKMKELLKK